MRANAQRLELPPVEGGTSRGIRQRFEDSFPVSNLTIGDFHNYAVGSDAILVHNESLCERAIADLQELLNQGKKTLDQIADDLRKLDYPDEVVDDAVGRLKAPTSRFGGVVANTAEEAAFLRNAAATFGDFSVFNAVRRFDGNIIIQRSDIPFSVQNVRSMASGNTPFVRNHLGQWEQINLHHVGRQDGKLIEILRTQNRYDNVTGGPLHIPDPGEPAALPKAVREAYWRQRLQDAIDAGLAPQDVLRQLGL